MDGLWHFSHLLGKCYMEKHRALNVSVIPRNAFTKMCFGYETHLNLLLEIL